MLLLFNTPKHFTLFNLNIFVFVKSVTNRLSISQSIIIKPVIAVFLT